MELMITHPTSVQSCESVDWMVQNHSKGPWCQLELGQVTPDQIARDKCERKAQYLEALGRETLFEQHELATLQKRIRKKTEGGKNASKLQRPIRMTSGISKLGRMCEKKNGRASHLLYTRNVKAEPPTFHT
jgi:hypothetical protein